MTSSSWEAFLNIYKSLENKGQLLKTKGHWVFFSDDRFQLSDLSSKYQMLHQVHGNKIIESGKDYPLADGQWTTKKNWALVIKTADCLPVFLSDHQKVLALHIGWRGFTNKILEQGLKQFSSTKNLKAYIGPHIGYDSFQVNESIALDILLAQNLSWKKVYTHNWVKKSFRRPNHLFINLQAILSYRLHEMGIQSIQSTQIDTCTSPHHFSHRRNPNRKGTNYSFIMKI